LREVSVLPVTVPILSFPVADSILGIHDSAKTALEKNKISKDEGSQWLAELERLDREGCFFSSLTGFGVFGTKN
jgi:hypothetical protein